MTRVVPGSAAERAGLRVGDRVVRFAGTELSPSVDFTGIALSAASPATATITRAGEKEPRELSIQLAGQPVEIGIAWREDDAEQGTVKLVRVVPGSPAARAGLRVLDRVYEVNGQLFANSQDFLSRLETGARPLEMVVEQHGQIRKVSIEAPPTTK